MKIKLQRKKRKIKIVITEDARFVTKMELFSLLTTNLFARDAIIQRNNRKPLVNFNHSLFSSFL